MPRLVLIMMMLLLFQMQQSVNFRWKIAVLHVITGCNINDIATSKVRKYGLFLNNLHFIISSENVNMNWRLVRLTTQQQIDTYNILSYRPNERLLSFVVMVFERRKKCNKKETNVATIPVLHAYDSKLKRLVFLFRPGVATSMKIMCALSFGVQESQTLAFGRCFNMWHANCSSVLGKLVHFLFCFK